MTSVTNRHGPILRLFLAQAKPGKKEQVRTLFATTSVDVVRGQAGNLGWFSGPDLAEDSDRLMFASLWQNLDAVKRRFGRDWSESHLSQGYAELLAEHSVQHFDLSEGWFVADSLQSHIGGA